MDRMGIRSTNAILEVCQEMEEYTPPVCLYVTTHYSATEIPGFFSVIITTCRFLTTLCRLN